MQKADVILPGLVTAFGAIIMWQSLTQMDYFYADRGAPGPGFLPFWVSFGVVVLGLIVTVREIRMPADEAPVREWPDALGKRRIIYLLGGFLAFLLVIPLIGFVLASILFMFIVSLLLGMHQVKTAAIASILIGLFMHLVFDKWLMLSLPKGILGDYVGGALPWIF